MKTPGPSIEFTADFNEFFLQAILQIYIEYMQAQSIAGTYLNV